MDARDTAALARKRDSTSIWSIGDGQRLCTDELMWLYRKGERFLLFPSFDLIPEERCEDWRERNRVLADSNRWEIVYKQMNT